MPCFEAVTRHKGKREKRGKGRRRERERERERERCEVFQKIKHPLLLGRKKST
jgi:hypothetical protein